MECIIERRIIANALEDNGAIEISLESLGHLIFIHFSLQPYLPFSRRRSRIFDIAVEIKRARERKETQPWLNVERCQVLVFAAIRLMTRDDYNHL